MNYESREVAEKAYRKKQVVFNTIENFYTEYHTDLGPLPHPQFSMYFDSSCDFLYFSDLLEFISFSLNYEIVSDGCSPTSPDTLHNIRYLIIRGIFRRKRNYLEEYPQSVRVPWTNYFDVALGYDGYGRLESALAHFASLEELIVVHPDVESLPQKRRDTLQKGQFPNCQPRREQGATQLIRRCYE